MTHHIRRYPISAILWCLLVLTASPRAQVATAPVAPAAPVAPPDATIVQRVDEYMQAELKVNGFSGTILLARKGAPILAKGYGHGKRRMGASGTHLAPGFDWDRSPSSSHRWR